MVLVALESLEIHLIMVTIRDVSRPGILGGEDVLNNALRTEDLLQWLLLDRTTLGLGYLLATIESFRLDRHLDCQYLVFELLRSLRASYFLLCGTSSIIHQINCQYFLLSLFTCLLISLEKLTRVEVTN